MVTFEQIKGIISYVHSLFVIKENVYIFTNYVILTNVCFLSFKISLPLHFV